MCSSNSSKRTQAPHTVSKFVETILDLELGAANIDAGINRAQGQIGRTETQRNAESLSRLCDREALHAFHNRSNLILLLKIMKKDKMILVR